MATLTIRNLGNSTKKKLRLIAAQNDVSMEEMARRILRNGVVFQSAKKDLGSRIHQKFAELGGVDLEIPTRSAPRSTLVFIEDEN